MAYGTAGSNEQTPLAAVGAAAQQMLTKENTEKAASIAKEELTKLAEAAKRGDMSIRALALMGGVAMVVTSILGLLGRFVTLHWLSMLMDAYLTVLGLLVILLEGKRYTKKLPKKEIDGMIRKYAYFLDFIWGRGCLYFFIGSLQMAQASILDISVGAYMCFVGVTYIISGRHTAKKLEGLRKSLYSEAELRRKFEAADVENRGSLNCDQFQNMLQQFGIVLNMTEVESAFLSIEKVEDERIGFAQFVHWWTTAEFDNDQNAQFALSV
mmetsp:Transcript_24935/g.72138  ORF Transcript_24935/g.72138 Transcript_24935/m.72138 type:complete len:268 (-) Transcript_24935:306-1109(-)